KPASRRWPDNRSTAPREGAVPATCQHTAARRAAGWPGSPASAPHLTAEKQTAREGFSRRYAISAMACDHGFGVAGDTAALLFLLCFFLLLLLSAADCLSAASLSAFSFASRAARSCASACRIRLIATSGSISTLLRSMTFC